MKLTIALSLGLALLSLSSCQERRSPNQIALDATFDKFVASIHIDSLSGIQPQVTSENVSVNLVRVGIKYQLNDSIHQDDWKVTIRPAFKPTSHWAPHLTPTDEHIITQHVFRSPAMIVSDSALQLVLIP